MTGKEQKAGRWATWARLLATVVLLLGKFQDTSKWALNQHPNDLLFTQHPQDPDVFVLLFYWQSTVPYSHSSWQHQGELGNILGHLASLSAPDGPTSGSWDQCGVAA